MRRASVAPALLGAVLSASAAEAPPTAAAGVPPMVIGTAPDPASVPLSVLPEGKGREVVISACALCHPIDLVVQQRRTQDEWDTLISRMADHGARASDAEQQVVFEYLVLHFGKEQGPPPAAP
jgi:cytochrome c5